MIAQILLAILLGTIAGIITGLIPGIHINLIAVLALSITPLLLEYISPVLITIFIISMAINHTFLDFIPSCFLGAPDDDTALSVLPAHSLLLKGRGYEAVKLATIGSLFGLILTIIITPILIPLIKKIYPIIENYIPYILLTAVFILVVKDKKKFYALLIFLISGVLGLGVLNLGMNQPLFPMFSGLFGTSMLILSLKDKIKIPPQKIISKKIEKKEIGKALGAAALASSLSGFLPGLGAAQAAVLASSLLKKINTRSFIILIGAINTIVMTLSFVALYILNKARNGAIIAVSKILGYFNLNFLILFLGCSLVVAGIATFLALSLAKISSKIISKIDYQRVCLAIILLITIMVLILSKPIGLLVLLISTLVGMLPPLIGVKRSHLMGCLILPIILFFIL